MTKIDVRTLMTWAVLLLSSVLAWHCASDQRHIADSLRAKIAAHVCSADSLKVSPGMTVEYYPDGSMMVVTRTWHEPGEGVTF